FAFSNFSVSYSAITQKVTVTGGTTALKFSLSTNEDSGAPSTTSKHMGWCTAGYSTGNPNDSALVSGTQTLVGQNAMTAGCFYWANGNQANLLWNNSAAPDQAAMTALGLLIGADTTANTGNLVFW